MWHYLVSGNPVGPVDDARMAELIGQRVVVRESLVWRQGMPQWQRADQTDLAVQFGSFAAVPPPVPSYAPVHPHEPSVQTASGASATQPYPVVGSAASAPGSYGSAVPASYPPSSFRNLWTWMAWLIGGGSLFSIVIIGLPALIAGCVLYYILLYRFWAILQGLGARTTPGVAVGFSFIPFFNLYWGYVAVVGLCDDINAHLARTGIRAAPVRRDLAMAQFILGIITVVPYLGLLALIPYFVILILLWKQLVDAAEAITAARSGTPSA